MATETREATLAIDIRLDGATITGSHVGHAVADLKDLNAQLVSGNARIAEERHLAQIPGIVRPANADAMDPHQRFSRPRPARLGNLDLAELLWLHKDNGFHQKEDAHKINPEQPPFWR